MKKIIAVCLAFALIVCSAPAVFATEDTCAGVGESEIRCYIYSSYFISIPELIDLGTCSYSKLGLSPFADAEVSITNANIAPGYKVDVFVTNLNQNGAIEITNMERPEYTSPCRLKNLEDDVFVEDGIPLVSFYDTELELWGTFSKTFRVYLGAFSLAGDYAGIMTYSFSCSPY